MEYCAIVPYVVSPGCQLGFANIGDEPLDAFRGCPQPPFGHVDGSLRNIKHGDVLVSASKQIVNQRRFATANINNSGRTCGRGSFYEFKGCLEVGTIPADGVWRLLSVDPLPMSLHIHTKTNP